MKYNVLDDPSAKAMEVGITIIYGPGLNQTGNTVLAGHNYRNGTFFSNNNKLSSGDKIYITDLSGKKVTYTIYKKYKTDETVISNQGKLELYKKIQKLDEKTRDVIYLRITGDLNFKEIGDIFNKTENWARITFYRGKQKLKEVKLHERKRM